MPQTTITIKNAQVEQIGAPDGVTATVKNTGPDTAYYGSAATVTSTSFDGSIASGSSVSFAATKYFTTTSTGAARLFVVVPTLLEQLRADLTVPLNETSGVFCPEDFGARGDVVNLSDGVTTASSGVVTSATASFGQADVGKRVSIGGAATGPVDLHTTIASVQSATQMTMTTVANVSLTGAKFSYATDDTAAVQAAANAAVAAPGGGTLRLLRFYATTSALDITGSCTVSGVGSSGKFGNYGTGTLPDGAGLGVPWSPPYLVGSGLHVMAGGLTAAITITVEGAEINLREFGIRFAAPFFSTGHGVHQVPGATKNGIQNSLWENVKVWGHDGASYGFNISNFFHTEFRHLRAWGGGLVQMTQNHGSWAYGNSSFFDCTGKLFCGTTAHCWNVIATSGAMSQIGFYGCGSNCVFLSKYGFTTHNSRSLSAITAAQKLANIPQGAIQGLMMANHSWDEGTTLVTTPTLPTTASSSAGQWIDPSGWGQQTFSYKMMATASSDITLPGEWEGVFENLGTGTITASVFYDIESASAGNITRTLPALSAFNNRTITIKKSDATANTVTIARAGSDTIDGATTYVLTAQYQKVTLLGGVSQWWVVGT